YSFLSDFASDVRAVLSFPTRRSSDLNDIPGKRLTRLELGPQLLLVLQDLAQLFDLLHAVGVQNCARAAGRDPVDQDLRSCDRHQDRKSTRLNSSHVKNSYAVFCLKKN